MFLERFTFAFVSAPKSQNIVLKNKIIVRRRVRSFVGMQKYTYVTGGTRTHGYTL